MNVQSLSGPWKLRGEFLDIGPERINEVLTRPEGEFRIVYRAPRHFPVKSGWMTAQVPCDVITPLIEHGLMQEPLEGCNTKDCAWTKEFSWWFKRDVHLGEDMLNHERVLLHFETLDHKADIFVNGIPVGHHRNTFRPFEEDVKRQLLPGRNEIVVRLTCGIEDYPETDSVAYYCTRDGSIADQRIYLRKPQFVFGWDFCHPVPTCGIGRGAALIGVSGAYIMSFRLDTHAVSAQSAEVSVHFALNNLRMESTDDATLSYDIRFEDEVVYEHTQELYITGGLSHFDQNIAIPQPRLWWPNGYGEQALYEVRARLTCRGATNEMPLKHIGIRTLALDESKLPDGTRNFTFVINGVRVFCKGGNWIPADSVYLRVPDSTYHALVQEAAACNFTMLRMWGSGTYEPDCFYEYCSRYGILLMHDFMYSCAFYPDHLDWFLHEATLEARYQVARLSHYPCMAIWTGNNEIHESYTNWFTHEGMPNEPFYGAKIFNYVQPQAVYDWSPTTPYLPSSPFGGENANVSGAGDSHVWDWLSISPVCFKFLYELEAFDRLQTRFSSEYGFFGALRLSSIERYHAGKPVVRGGDIWVHHGEYARKRHFIDNGIDCNITDFGSLTMEQYLIYSGILQGFLYREMAESLRCKSFAGGVLIWTYNDCWPETGWSAIDYYLTRKISFYFLKRAFATRKLILRVANGQVTVIGINDTPQPLDTRIEYGYTNFDGETSQRGRAPIHLDAHQSGQVLKLPAPNYSASQGYYFVRSMDGEPLCATSVRAYFRDMGLPPPQAEIVKTEPDGNDLLVTIKAHNYIPVAYLDLADDRTHLSDNFFELLPGQVKQVHIIGCHDQPTLVCPAFAPYVQTPADHSESANQDQPEE